MKQQGEVYLYLERYRGGDYADQVISRAENALCRRGVTGMDQLLEWSDESIGKLRNVGRGTKAFIRRAAEDYRGEKARVRSIQEGPDLDETAWEAANMKRDTKLVIVVEDDDHLRHCTKEMLEMQGYTVYEAENLARARRALDEWIPFALLLDGNLPDGNGYDFCPKIREQGFARPVCILTAGQMLPSDVAASGADHAIAKPFDYKDLFAWLE